MAINVQYPFENKKPLPKVESSGRGVKQVIMQVNQSKS